MSIKLSDLAREIDAELVGDGETEVSSVATLDEAGPGQVSFLANPRYADRLSETRASAVIVGPTVSSPRVALLRTRDPYLGFTKAMVRLHGHRTHPAPGIHPKAHVEPSATVGEGTVIYPGAYVGAGARIGRDCVLYPNVVVYDGCVLGDRVIVHAGGVIGADGFGYATSQGVHHKIPQVGIVEIEDDVEVGANACIDRAALGRTVIGRGTKIDNLVTVGHNVRIGPHGLLVAQAGVAGSTTLGHHVTVAGQSGIGGHLKIGDNVTVGGQSAVTGDVPSESTVMGGPAMPIAQARRVYAVLTQLPELRDRVRQLEQQVQELGTRE